MYDIVVDFAGVAHINHIKKNMKELFYSVNRDLTIELGQHAKDNSVNYFIYFSSMNVYGDYRIQKYSVFDTWRLWLIV